MKLKFIKEERIINKENKYTYMFFKIFVLIILLLLFFLPGIFTIGGYGLSVDGVVIARSGALLLAIYIFNQLVDTIINNKNDD